MACRSRRKRRSNNNGRSCRTKRRTRYVQKVPHHVRPGPVRSKPRSNTISHKVTRILRAAAPLVTYEPTSKAPLITKSWLGKLEDYGVVVMKMIAAAAGALTSNDNILNAYPTTLLAAMDIAIDDLLHDSPLSRDIAQSAKLQQKEHYFIFSQGKVNWLKVAITPTAQTKNRSGMIAASLTPLARGRVYERAAGSSRHASNYQQVLFEPGAVEGPANKPLYLSYSPSIDDIAHTWIRVGHKYGDPLSGDKLNDSSNVFARLHIAYTCTDFDYDRKDYTPQKGFVDSPLSISEVGFNITFEAGCEFRLPSEVVVKSDPIYLHKPQQVGIVYGKHCIDVDPEDLLVPWGQDIHGHYVRPHFQIQYQRLQQLAYAADVTEEMN